MNRVFQFLIWTTGVVIPVVTFGQSVEMADGLRSSGKIYVVVGIVLIVLIGLVLYLVTLDRKISRIEREIGEQKDQKPA